MRVIITGGTGLIGQALCANLAHDNHEVIVLSRDPDRAGALPADVKLASWDAQSAEGWGELADGADAIVNLAGENLASGPWTDARKRRIRDSRINAGKAVMQAVTAAQRKPRVLIQSSAVGYYGPRGDETITEDASPGIDFLARLCFEWEASTAGVEEMGVRRVVVRTGLVLSADGGPCPKSSCRSSYLPADQWAMVASIGRGSTSTTRYGRFASCWIQTVPAALTI